MSLKQTVSAPLLNAWQQLQVSRLLVDDHYNWMSRVIIGVALQRTLTTPWPSVPSIGENLQSFTGNGDVSNLSTIHVIMLLANHSSPQSLLFQWALL